jgi:hypothetical protein
MLSNLDIERICDKLKLPIIGVFSKDTLPDKKEGKIGSYYINLQNHNEGSGTHWVMCKIYCDDERDNESFAVDKKGKRVYRCGAIYFDPFGIGMPREVEEFLSPFKPVAYSTRQIQSVHTSQCGWYCILCDYTLENKQHSETYLEDFEKFLNMWSEKQNENLTLLKSYFKPL